MSRAFFLYIGALAVLAGCAAKSAQPPVIVGTGPSPAPPVAPSMADDEIVALVNGRPVTRRDVADRAFQTDAKNLIDQYIRWKIRQDRIAELGISVTDDELKKRAQAIVDGFRRNQGEEALKKQLAESGLSEEQYVDRFRRTPEFADRLTTEKAFFYDLLTEGSVEFDSIAFQSEDLAKQFVATLKNGIRFDDAALMIAQGRQDIARWPRYRIARGLSVDSIAKSPWIEKTLFSLKADEVSGVEHTSSGFFLVLRCVSIEPAKAASFGELRGRISEEALKGQITDDQLRTWLDRRVKACTIEYKDKYLPREK